MLVSISFQFVGFLLTYLLHTTHAARLGSRAGLGVTLIQYGFALKGKMDTPYAEGDTGWTWGPASGNSTTAETDAAAYYRMSMGNSTLSEEQAAMLVADATTEWLSFFLMTVGKASYYVRTPCQTHCPQSHRLVRPPHFPTRILESQTLGARDRCVTSTSGFRPASRSW
jgi:hypothetical protein